MVDADAIAAALELTAQEKGWPQLSRVVEFTTTQGNLAMANVTVTISDPGINEVDDSLAVAFSQSAQVVPLDVLANDSDNATGGNANLRIGSLTQPTAGQGTVAINTDGRRVDWSVPAGFFGQAQFTYTAVRV